MRKVFECTNGNETARVYWNAEWEEYIVKFYSQGPDGKPHLLKGADYHDSDRESAISTAKQWTE